MKAQLIKIGNSRGLRIPKALMEQVGLESEVELEASQGCLVVRPSHRPREGWGERFRQLAKCGDDALIDGDLAGQSSFDNSEWQWK